MSAFKHYQTFSKATSTSVALIDISDAIAEVAKETQGFIQVIITTETESLVVKFGDSSVVADDTVADDAYPAGNYYCLASTVQDINIDRGVTHASVKAAGVGSVKISIGYEV